MNNLGMEIMQALSGQRTLHEASAAMRSASLRIQRDDEVFDQLYEMFANEMDYATDTGPNRAMRVCQLIDYALGKRPA